MSQENLEVVERAIAAVNARDIDGYLACCTQDVRLETPMEISGVYEGQDSIRRFFEDLSDTTGEFTLAVESLRSSGPDQVLAFLRLTSSGRISGIDTGSATGNVYDLVDGKIARVRIFLDRREALKTAGLEA
jgi:ketosteroid isomerase-like protein